MFDKIVNDALNFGMGVTSCGKEKVEKLAEKVQKKCGVTKAESVKMVKEMIARGEKIRVQFEKDFLSTQADLFEKLEKFSCAKKEELKKKSGKPAPKKAKACGCKKTAKKTAKKAVKKPAPKA